MAAPGRLCDSHGAAEPCHAPGEVPVGVITRHDPTSSLHCAIVDAAGHQLNKVVADMMAGRHGGNVAMGGWALWDSTTGAVSGMPILLHDAHDKAHVYFTRDVELADDGLSMCHIKCDRKSDKGGLVAEEFKVALNAILTLAAPPVCDCCLRTQMATAARMLWGDTTDPAFTLDGWDGASEKSWLLAFRSHTEIRLLADIFMALASGDVVPAGCSPSSVLIVRVFTRMAACSTCFCAVLASVASLAINHAMPVSAVLQCWRRYDGKSDPGYRSRGGWWHPIGDESFDEELRGGQCSTRHVGPVDRDGRAARSDLPAGSVGEASGP
jgi:hypothetical protein